MSPKRNHFTEVRKRDGRIVPFDQDRITSAIQKAMLAAGEGHPEVDAERVSDQVVNALAHKFTSAHVPSIEQVQDMVETQLMATGFTQTAKAYILYRNERARLREEKREVPEHVRELAAQSKKYFRNPLGEFIFYRTYSRWIEEESRRETWIETIDRYLVFMKENLGSKLTDEEYHEIREGILNQEAMPSMRLLQFAGRATRSTNVTAYNCSFIAPSKLQDFAEITYISMCGTGVGFSVENQNVQQLPQIKKQTGEKLPTYVIPDSKKGWADSLAFGMQTWFDGKDVEFDYSELRPAGARLKTMGGKSSGPDPLRSLLNFTRAKILKKQGRRLSNLDVHDVICKIGEIVVAGGVRRSALISLSDLDDTEMRDAKKGQFYVTEPQRSLANNSAVYNQKPTAAEFMDEWISLMKSGSGERGLFNRGGLAKTLPERRLKALKGYIGELGTNPCITGDTLVYVADGRGNVPIKQLAEEGKDVPVFCLDNKDKVTIRYMRNPRLTGKDLPVYKLTLDDGSTVKTTSDHKFLNKSGEYKEVKDLKYGDSLHVLTKYEASIKDIFPKANSRSQDYWWINNGLAKNEAEHRSIAEFHYNTTIPLGYVVHHKDRNAQNNNPENLEILTKTAHDNLHAKLMLGDLNPMRRAKDEWNEKKWTEYKLKHSQNNIGDKNRNFSGVTEKELKIHAIKLTKTLGSRFSANDWKKYAEENKLPQYFSKWRRDHLGNTTGLAKWAAQELNLENIDVDPRLIKSYKKYTAEGYNCEIIDNQLFFIKNCEVCGREFKSNISNREFGVCSISCGLKQKWQDKEFKAHTIKLINASHAERKEKVQKAQAKIYSDLKFKLGRDPYKKEWQKACQENKTSPEISRASSPFSKYENLKEYASNYNHKVVSVEFCGREDVYNGTVDEFHNFFIGGFGGKTRNNKKKFAYLNNRQCGEIILQNKQFCNLSEVVCRAEDTEESLLHKVRLATILGTYQATLTYFPYLSKEWTENCEEERLLGVSMTGQWDSVVARKPEVLNKLREEAIKINQEYSKRFKINQSTCITCVKPSGNLSQTVDCASGLHPRHSKYYIRRVRIAHTDSLFKMLRDQKIPYHPEVGQSMETATTYVVDFPVKSPEGAVFKNNVTALELLEHWKAVKTKFTEHNPSVTISVGDEEWIAVADWLYDHWDWIGGLSFLPRSNHVYQLAPYEEITESEYRELAEKLEGLDFSQIMAYEKRDETDLKKELACVGGVCEIDEVTAETTVATV